jgi:tetratricopeptide (TPR) repeat protein
MDEKPKSIWKKSWAGWRGFLLWLVIVSVAAFIAALTNELFGNGRAVFGNLAPVMLFVTGGFVVAVAVVFIFYKIIRWLCRWRNFKRFLFGCACFVTLIALFYAEEDWRGKHDWEKFKRRWEAKGEHFDYASISPPPVPDDQNFAMQPIWVDSIKFEFGTNVAKQWYGETLTETERTNLVDRLNLSISGNEDLVSSPPQTSDGYWAKGTITNLKLWQNYYRRLAAKTNEFPVPLQPQSPAADVLLALSKYDSAIEELRQASKLPYSRFPVYSDADHPFDTLLPHLSIFKRCAQILKLRAIAELQNGQSDKALEDVKLAVELTEKIRSEPFLISHLVRIAMLQLTLQPIYEGLANHQWSSAQLAELDSELAKLDFLADYELSIRGERAASVSTLDYIRRTRDLNYMNNISGSGSKPHRILQLVFSHFTTPDAFFYQNELTIARMYQQYDLPMVDLENGTVSPIQVRNLQTKADRDMSYHWWPCKIFARMLFPAIENAVKKLTYAQSSTALARVAIALERYRLAHGEFPDSLDALAPQFIEKIPHDVIGGQPLHYRRTDDGQFVLYSVGWNETDDGGVVGLDKFRPQDPPNINKGDWVWRYPQK